MLFLVSQTPDIVDSNWDVAELKMWLLALCQVSAFDLEHGEYEAVDLLNITSVPPRGRIMPRQCDI